MTKVSLCIVEMAGSSKPKQFAIQPAIALFSQGAELTSLSLNRKEQRVAIGNSKGEVREWDCVAKKRIESHYKAEKSVVCCHYVCGRVVCADQEGTLYLAE